jgi:hypothetical protein
MQTVFKKTANKPMPAGARIIGNGKRHHKTDALADRLALELVRRKTN